MAKSYQMLIAGFGGQGILFAGKVLAYSGLMDEREVSWLPSYGPEMRGGTANCSVCVSDEPISSPLVLTPNVFIAMNIPSYDKFIAAVEPGGICIIDSSLIDKKCHRTDIDVYYVDATKLADENNLKGLANMIILGKLLKETNMVSLETVQKALEKCIPAKKLGMLEKNLQAIQIGMAQ